MPSIGIILGSTRPNRNGEQVARWVLEIASTREDAQFELVDLRDYPLMTEFENFSVFKPGDYNIDALHTLLDEVIAWSAALAPLRNEVAVAP